MCVDIKLLGDRWCPSAGAIWALYYIYRAIVILQPLGASSPTTLWFVCWLCLQESRKTIYTKALKNNKIDINGRYIYYWYLDQPKKLYSLQKRIDRSIFIIQEKKSIPTDGCRFINPAFHILYQTILANNKLPPRIKCQFGWYFKKKKKRRTRSYLIMWWNLSSSAAESCWILFTIPDQYKSIQLIQLQLYILF